MCVEYCWAEINSRLSLELLVKIVKKLKNFDVLHVESVFDLSTLVSFFAAVLYKKKVICSPRGSISYYTLGSGNKIVKKLFLRFIIWCTKKLDVKFHFTSLKESAETQDILSDLYGALNITGFLVPNSVPAMNQLDEASMLRNLKLSQRLSDKNKITIGYIGRINRKKRLELQISAANNLKDTISEFDWLFAGSSDDGSLADLNDLVTSYSLDNHVSFVGFLDGENKQSFLKNLDILVLASETENFGNVILEALLYGAKIVFSDNLPWDNLEVLTVGKSCQLNECSISDAVKKIINAKGLNEVNLLAVESLLTRFTSSTVAKKMRVEYEIW